MFSKIKDKLKSYFKSYCLMMGIMSFPVLIVDLISKQIDYRLLWLVFAFSAIIPVLNVIYESVNIFREKIILRRVVFFIIIVTIMMTFSWNMGIIDNIIVLLSGIGGCVVVGIPTLLVLGYKDKKRGEELDAMLQRYKNQNRNIEDKNGKAS